MDAVLTLVGVALILLGLRDMFHTLLHPSGRGGLSRNVLRATWWAVRPLRRHVGSSAGAAGMVLAIGLWVVLQVVGWALIYLPHLPAGFLYSPGLDPADYGVVAEALYVSLVTLTTLGFGDVVAAAPVVRAIAPFQALLGFALLTAAMTWFSQIYPPLSRRRALATQLAGMASSDLVGAAGSLDAEDLARRLDAISEKAGEVRVDFAQHPEGFYFREDAEQLALARQLPYTLEVLDAALERQESSVRVSAGQLRASLDDLARVLDEQFLRAGGSTAATFAAFAADHRHELSA